MSTQTILVVDDEEDILELVKYNLQIKGYTVLCVQTGEEALHTACGEHIDLILLDLMLPGINGLEVARQLKKNSHTQAVPVIMLSAKGEETDIVAGFELGADDFITKPFSPKILQARVQAVLRRQKNTAPDSSGHITAFDLSIDQNRHQVKVKGQTVNLTFTEFQLLALLAKRPGWVFTRGQIVDGIKGADYFVTDRSVDVQVVGLRKKLRECGTYIETVRGVGYRFKEQV